MILDSRQRDRGARIKGLGKRREKRTGHGAWQKEGGDKEREVELSPFGIDSDYFH